MIVCPDDTLHCFMFRPFNAFAEQGTTQKLSNAWMPLDEFTRKEMEGLKRGDLHVPVGMSADNYEKYNEKGKVEQAMQMHERIKAMSKEA